jgi:DNA repair exonuclease SbcCD ATPase subunit
MKQNLRELFEANADLQSQLAALRAENEQLQRQASARPATPSEPALAPSLVSATEPPPAATSSAADGASDAEERLRVMQAEADRDRQALLARLSERELQLDRLRDQVAAVPALQRELQASREQLAAAEARLQALQRDAAATREQLAATEARLQTLQRDSQSAYESLCLSPSR